MEQAKQLFGGTGEERTKRRFVAAGEEFFGTQPHVPSRVRDCTQLVIEGFIFHRRVIPQDARSRVQGARHTRSLCSEQAQAIRRWLDQEAVWPDWQLALLHRGFEATAVATQRGALWTVHPAGPGV